MKAVVQRGPITVIATVILACITTACSVGDADTVQEETSPSAASVMNLEEMRGLIDAGLYADAESAARERLALVEEIHGERSLEAGLVLDLLVESFWRSGRSREPEARELADRAIEIKRETVGDPSLELAVSQRNLAILMEDSGDYAGARSLYEFILETRLEALGDEDPLVAKTLRDIGNLSLNTDKLVDALDYYQRALAIQRRALGEGSADVARTLNNIATVHWESGDFHAAEANYVRSLSIKEQLPGDHDLDVAWTLNGLALVRESMGHYEQAKQDYRRALELRRKVLGEDHLHVAWVLNNLANLHRLMGDYEEARFLYNRSIEIKRDKLEANHPSTAISKSNLADLLRLMGDLVTARELYEESMEIRLKAFGKDRTEVAVSKQRLADLLAETGDFERAKALCEQALDIWEKNVGASHPSYATGLDTLGGVLARMGDYEAAKAQYSEGLKIRRNELDEGHPDIADSLFNLADLWVQTGDLRRAEGLYREAQQIREETLGVRHPDVASVLSRHSRVLAWLGEDGAALESAILAEEIGAEHLRLTMRTLAERQALNYASTRSSGLDTALLLAARESPKTSSVRAAWDSLARSRALVLDEMAARRRSVDDAGDPEVAIPAKRLEQASRVLANLTIRGPGPDRPEQYRSLLDIALRDKEQAERELAEKSLEFRQALARKRIGLGDVEQALPDGAALVAFALFDRYEAATEPPVRSYLAFVLPSNESPPAVVPLSTAEKLDRLASEWIREASKVVGFDDESVRAAESAYRRAGNALRREVWAPLVPLLGDAHTVFVVPDGALHLVNLSVLPIGQSSYLIESGPVIHYLSAERGLVAQTKTPSRGLGMLALGGPDFDDVADLATHDSILPSTASQIQFRGKRSTCGDLRTIRFQALPAAARETEELVSLWRMAGSSRATADGTLAGQGAKVVHLTGADASEAAFKGLAPGRRMLHLATHGFFLADCPSALGTTRGIGGLSPRTTDAIEVQEVENPLLLSGLALAGANRRTLAGPDDDDGILTAEEIAAMNLSGVEWAVLSACDTGIGEVRAGEGVFGLRRAFQIAGARTVIMSLWAVEDRSAREWMRELYERRLIGGLNTAEAVRMASLRLLEQRREDGETTHPFYWGAFVASGAWY